MATEVVIPDQDGNLLRVQLEREADHPPEFGPSNRECFAQLENNPDLLRLVGGVILSSIDPKVKRHGVPESSLLSLGITCLTKSCQIEIEAARENSGDAERQRKALLSEQLMDSLSQLCSAMPKDYIPALDGRALEGLFSSLRRDIHRLVVGCEYQNKSLNSPTE